jgi:hypothetical protein
MVWKIVVSVWSATVKIQTAGFCVLNLSTYKILHQLHYNMRTKEINVLLVA